MKTALPTGIFDPSEAPWWRFTCEDYEPVVTQWMGEAAAKFAAILAGRNAGGEITSLTCVSMALDGMNATYVMSLSEHPREFILIVTRDPEACDKPEEPDNA